MSDNHHKNRFQAIRFGRSYTAEDFQITASELLVRKEAYPLNKMKQVALKQLGYKDHAIRAVCIALVLSAATWAFVPALGIFVFVGCLPLALLTAKKYELRAEFRSSDEAGDQWVPLVRCSTQAEFEQLKTLHAALETKLSN
ncbi:hypothetical protein VV869_16940 [Photobacterium sp. MCCC 1A19761]|uniref:hypothetical protein n=1 Tax=Photobacterium sp. MCCC 1A19761 TaxID=3115000 RepID=UPI00307EDCBC